MRLVLTRTGGFTGSTLRWELETDDEEGWVTLIERSGLRLRPPLLGQVGRMVLLGAFGPGERDHSFALTVDGRRRASFRGVDVTGPLAELVARLTQEGTEIHSP